MNTYIINRQYIIYIIIALATIASSCQKSYTCACTDGSPNNIVFTEEIVADNQEEAQQTCNAMGIECDLI